MRRAFVDGVSVLDKDTMNSLLEFQDFSIVYEGTSFDSKTGTGSTENSLADYNYAIRITATGTSEIGRITLNADKDGTGVDISWELRDSTWSNTGLNDGLLVASGLYPKEFIETTPTTINIPLAISGLTVGSNYWLIIKKAGSGTDKIDLIGESSQDAAHPVYRRSGTSGAWTLNNAIQFNAYNWSETGNIISGNEGGQIDWLNYYNYGLLGTIGDCENSALWTASASTLTTDTTNIIQGVASLKVTITSTSGRGFYNVFSLLDPAKYYLISGWIKHGSGTYSQLRIYTDGTGSAVKTSASITNTGAFNVVGCVLTPTDWGSGSTYARVAGFVAGAASDYGYFDSIKIHEITAADSVLAESQLLEKYPNLPEATSGSLYKINSYIPAINGDESKSVRETMTLTGLKKGVVSSA